MTLIRSISDLRNHAMEISKLCHAEDQPVFITRNGKGDMVVMSQTHYERIQSLIELYQKLGEAEILDASGETGISHKMLMQQLKDKISGRCVSTRIKSWFQTPEGMIPFSSINFPDW